MSARLSLASSVIVLSLFAAACLSGGGGPAATPTPDRTDEEEALAAWVRDNRNVNFVQNCRDAEPGIDVGKWCSNLIGERGTLRAYALGPVFSEPTSFAMLEETSEGWQVLSVTNRDPSAGDVPGIPWPLIGGDAVVVVGLRDDDCLSIRDRASQSGQRLQCVATGTRAIVQEDTAVEAEGFTWSRIAGQDAAGQGFNGWAAGTWLRLEAEIQRLFEATATPAPD